MMRRGELSQHALADVLRTAAAERLSGGVELDGEDPVCVFLEAGEVYLVARTGAEAGLTVDDDLDDAAYDAALRADEERLRASSVTVLAEVLLRDEGWYFFHDLTDHPARGHWAWTVDRLIFEAEMEAGPAHPSPDDVPSRAEAGGGGTGEVRRAQTLAGGGEPDPSPTEHPADVAPAPPPEPEVPSVPGLGRWAEVTSVLPTGPVAQRPRPEDWAVLAAMAAPVAPAELARRLGWPGDHLAAVLDDMVKRGLLGAERPTPPRLSGSPPSPS